MGPEGQPRRIGWEEKQELDKGGVIDVEATLVNDKVVHEEASIDASYGGGGFNGRDPEAGAPTAAETEIADKIPVVVTGAEAEGPTMPGKPLETPAEAEAKLNAKNAADLASTTEFDPEMREAFDTPGFIEFIAKYKDAKEADMSPETLRERFEVFQVKNEITKQYWEIANDEIAGENGLKLDANDRAEMNKVLEEMAIENPNELYQIRDEVKEYQETPAKIEAAQQELATLAVTSGFNQKIEAANTVENNLNSASKGLGFFGGTKMWAGVTWAALSRTPNESTGVRGAQKLLAKQGVPITVEGIANRRAELVNETLQIQREFGELQTKKTEALHDLQEQLIEIRKSLFAHAGLREYMQEAIGKKLKEQIAAMSLKNGLSGFDTATDTLKDKRVGSETGLEYITEENTEAVQKGLDQQAEKYISDFINTNLKNIKFGTKAFTNFENTLNKVITAERAGSKNQEETREFIVLTLRRAAQAFPDTVDGKARRILVRQLALMVEGNK
jgi:hypothetical protein